MMINTGKNKNTSSIISNKNMHRGFKIDGLDNF